ncbi:sigma-70 family RNA polymerase sigma factor [Rhodococcus sp. D2-41]|uniref:sigma-70 family RNA polymerase sigma factor n=1 Tax=Speluncibacter jeojiensis TaxID=2710754 RepID=UPI002410464D|nr:sigma-70 family RNA polymerase sigma factor [Rhodococcus sp. D2-41]MDG3012754.1 sigma-70 family RNA polymerase sigma factor [Rhodococcus sp. D2-41]
MDNEFLAREFETHRDHLRAVGYRMLGSTVEAEDAVQETWLRLGGADTTAVSNLGGWLTTVMSRVCLDMLRSRGSRRESSLDEHAQVDPADTDPGAAPEHEALLADSVGVAMLVVLDTLSPAERLAFVLHDMFAVPFDEIAPIIDRSPAATRQLASRARRRVQGPAAGEGADAPSPADTAQRQQVIKAFLTASREGRFDDLLTLLDPDVVLRADDAAVAAATAALAHGAPALAGVVHGADAVAGAFVGRAREARVVTLDGRPAAAYVPDGTARSVFTFTVVAGRIVELGVVADPGTLAGFDIDLAATDA